MTVTFQVGDREFGGSGNLEIDFWVGGCQFWSWSGSWLEPGDGECCDGSAWGQLRRTRANVCLIVG